MRADTLLLHLVPTMPAAILIATTPMHLLRKHPNEESQKKITNIYMRHQDEKEITENAAGHQPQQVKDSRCRSQLPKQIIEHRQGNDQKQPDA